MNFAAFLKTARMLTKQGEEARLKCMFLLVETKPQTAIWRMGPYVSWEALLKGERLCPVASFRDFERATQLLKRKTIEQVGVDTAIVVSRIEEPLRKPILDQVRGYIETYSTPPSRMLVWAWVRALRYTPPPQMTAQGLRSRARH